jgi:hypothetical protein
MGSRRFYAQVRVDQRTSAGFDRRTDCLLGGLRDKAAGHGALSIRAKVFGVLPRWFLDLGDVGLSLVIGVSVIALIRVCLLIGSGDEKQTILFQGTLYLAHYALRTLEVLDHFQCDLVRIPNLGDQTPTTPGPAYLIWSFASMVSSPLLDSVIRQLSQ